MAMDLGASFSVKGGVRTRLVDASKAALGFLSVIVCPTATGLKVDPSDSYKEIEEADCNANKVISLRYIEKSSLNLNIDFGNSSPELKLLALGQRLALNASDVAVPYGVAYVNAPDTLTPTTNASLVGVYGNGVVADTVAIGAVLIGGIANQLTQQPFAAFSFATPKTFAIGADGAMKFSVDLRGKVISVGGALYTVANVYDTLGSDQVTILRVQHDFIDTNRSMSIFEAEISLERTGIDLGAPNQSMKGLINGGKYRVRVIGATNRC